MRLRICGILAGVASAEFSALRDTLGLADSVVSKHLSRLELRGYVQLEKYLTSGRMHTRVSMTPHGRTSFTSHVAALNQITRIK